MTQSGDHLERARVAQWVLAISGLVLITISLNAKWASVHFPELIYIVIVIAFFDLVVLVYFLAHLIYHLRNVHREGKLTTVFTAPLKMLLGTMLVFTVADLLYATFTQTWNQYSSIILVGLLFGIAAIPFHIIHGEYAQRELN